MWTDKKEISPPSYICGLIARPHEVELINMWSHKRPFLNTNPKKHVL